MRYDVYKLSDFLELHEDGLSGQDRIVVHFEYGLPIRIRVWDNKLVNEPCDENGDLVD